MLYLYLMGNIGGGDKGLREDNFNSDNVAERSKAVV